MTELVNFKSFLVEMAGQHSYSSTQINLPDALARKIISFGKKHIPNQNVIKEGGKLQREDEIHVTVLYGFEMNSPNQVKQALMKVKPFQCELGKISMFSSPESDVVKIEVISSELQKLNKMLKNKFKVKSKFPTYVPHVTIAYAKKGMAKELLNDKTFVGMRFMADTVMFSSKNGVKTPMKLKG